MFVLGGGLKILNGCGEGKANIDLGAGGGTDFHYLIGLILLMHWLFSSLFSYQNC